MVHFQFISLLSTSSRNRVYQCAKNGCLIATIRKTSSVASYKHHVGDRPLLYNTIGDLVDIAAEKYPERAALISCHENRTLTFKQVQEETNKFAAALLAIGFKKGDRLAILGPNTVDWYITFLATAKAGLISVLLNPAYQPTEVEYCLNKVDVNGIVAAETFKTQNYYNTISEICPEISEATPGNLKSVNAPSLKNVIISTNKNLQGTYRWDDLLALADDEALNNLEKTQNSIKPEDPYNIQFTSGTTGAAKAAYLSHFSHVNNSHQISFRNELYSAHHRFCMQVPFFHAFGTDIIICPSLHAGATIVLPDVSYNPGASLRTIERHKCTYLNGTPTMYVDLVRKQRELNQDLSSVQFAVVGGAPCSPQLFKDILKVLHVKSVKSVYGLTETSGVIFQSLPGESEQNAIETVGYIQDHIEAKVVDENGNIVPFGTPGELLVRGYCNMIGYWNDRTKTKEMIDSNQWLHTGDKFVIREDGYGLIVGRLKDMIIRGGENIFPKEIEDFLLTHDDILENYVFGVNDERMGEEMFVCIRLRDGAKFTHDDLKAFCRKRLAHYKIPKYMRIVSEFPKTTSGKIQKFKLREKYEQELASQESTK